MKKIFINKTSFALVDNDDYEYLNQRKWSITKLGYVQAWDNEKKRSVHMQRLLITPGTGEQVDHINGDKLDNRRCNLRIADRSQNKANSNAYKNNTSGYKGVFFEKDPRVKTKKWRAALRINTKLVSLGRYLTKIEAAIAYNMAAKKYFGEFAKLNEV